ncbi:MAG: SIR2 family protein [Acidimicrobiales bacterium]
MTLEDLQEEWLAAQFLGSLLRDGELFLLLGAGVSAGIGLPSWSELVEQCEAAVGIAYTGPSRSADDLMRAIDSVARELKKAGRDATDLQVVVREALYNNNLRTAEGYGNEIIANPLLIALGALVMSSARGSVADVFTLNFDDLLEWYLHLHGFRTQVVSNFPVPLRGDRDVTVFHLHGFVPLVESAYQHSDWLVLSHSQLVARLASGYDQPWPTLLSSRLMSKRFLAVGTSMRDMDIDVLLTRARQMVGANSKLGVVVMADISDDRKSALLDLGVVPVDLGDFKKIPEFLLEVCRNAAAEG